MSKGYIGITNSDWWDTISLYKPSIINFWCTKSSFKILEENDYFFFLKKNNKSESGERKLVGYARYATFNYESVNQAWDKYGIGNGCEDKEIFLNRFTEVFDKSIRNIGCIELKGLVIFDKPLLLSNLSIDFQNSIVSGKSIGEEEVHKILGNINSDRNQTNKIKEDNNINELNKASKLCGSLINKEVSHSKFGKGTIIALLMNGISVEFENKIKLLSYDSVSKSLYADDNVQRILILLNDYKKTNNQEFRKIISKLNSSVINKQTNAMELNISDNITFDKSYEIINYIMGTSYSGWMKACYDINDEYFVWCPHLTTKHKPMKEGWTNELIDNGNTIIEANKDSSKNIKWADKKLYRKRIVFADFDGKKPYRFLGIFTFDSYNESTNSNKYVKVSDKIIFNEIRRK